MRLSVFCQQAHTVAKGAIDILAVVANENHKAQKYVTFGNNAELHILLTKTKFTKTVIKKT